MSSDYAVGTGVGRPCCFGIVAAQCGFRRYEGIADLLAKIGSRANRSNDFRAGLLRHLQVLVIDRRYTDDAQLIIGERLH